MKHDRMIYFCLCAFRDGKAWAERDIGRTNKRDTIEDICSGNLSNVVQVIELNYAEFSSRDVTEDFLPDSVRPEIRTQVMSDQFQIDHRRDYQKHEVA